uniref:Ribonuclease H protein At1g65750 family n=1 Tax=Cajanus cajan TaxID=3821 RepID=A0A151SYG0_CAJCA|nr:Putative ribonuclease H protein At1g65750 family [Cajanus cajan]
MNVALLGKLLWDFVENPTKPWVRLLSQKYLNGQSILCATKQRGSSQVWLSIVKAMGKLREGFQPCLADGQSSMWFDDWMGVGALGRLVQFVHISDLDRNVASFWEQGRWKFDSLSMVLPSEIATRVQQVQVPLVQSGRDTFAWIGEASGCYIVSSRVKFLEYASHSTPNAIWRRVWKLEVLVKISFFLWQGLHGALPTNHARYRRHLAPSSSCARCSYSLESIIHSLRDCPHSRQVWFDSALMSQISFAEMECVA